MAVISGTEKEKLIKLFQERGVNFYHACQWVDFKTYCALNGLPSRGLMESSSHNFTEFATDGRDKQNSVWNHVFGNLIDSGRPFSKGGDYSDFVATPNVFGPILLIFKPTVFNEVDDVAIALRSAGGRAFDRDKESLSTVEEVNKIFEYEDITKVKYQLEKSYIKFHKELKKVFPDRECANPEVSCSVKNELIPFDHLHEVIVDDIIVGGNTLNIHVTKMLKDMGIKCSVTTRRYAEGRKELLAELVDGLLKISQSTAEELANENESVKTDTDKWIERIIADNGRKFQFKRFIRYFSQGTIIELNKEAKLNPFDVYIRPPFEL